MYQADNTHNMTPSAQDQPKRATINYGFLSSSRYRTKQRKQGETLHSITSQALHHPVTHGYKALYDTNATTWARLEIVGLIMFSASDEDYFTPSAQDQRVQGQFSYSRTTPIHGYKFTLRHRSSQM